MSTDSILRAFGALTCIYTIGLFVTVMSTAALNAVANVPDTLCAGPACHATVAMHHAQPQSSDYPGVFHTAALFLAGE
jgi:hypothetical protein